MSLIKAFIICVNAAVAIAIIKGQSNEVVSSDCLQCLCEGATGCNLNLNCIKEGGYFCGPFEISWAYWADAGKPVVRYSSPESQGGFVACAKDMYCAAETVRRYMKKFSTLQDGDCNGDGVVDCIDFAKMHRMGGYACKEPDVHKTDFYKRFESCWDRIKSSRNKHSAPKT